MNTVETEAGTRKIVTIQDAPQHCTAERQPDGNTVAIDCPHTGKGEEFSPTNLVEAALGGCMLLSMGTLAKRNGQNIEGTKIEVKVTMTDEPRMRFGSIDVVVTMPPGLADKDRARLERAAGLCPVKHSFDPDIPISVHYVYPQ